MWVDSNLSLDIRCESALGLGYSETGIADDDVHSIVKSDASVVPTTGSQLDIHGICKCGC